MYILSKDGWIEVITGSMYAGKSEELIRRIKRLEYAKTNFKVFRPAIDNRYSETEVASHSGMKFESIIIKCASEILDHIDYHTQAICVDEVQFLDSKFVQIADDLADRGIRVICAGLDKDFRGEPFGIMPDLITKAEFVQKLTAICSVCGTPATRTQRLINGEACDYNDPIIQVGAVEAYEPRCRHCHEVKNRPRFIKATL